VLLLAFVAKIVGNLSMQYDAGLQAQDRFLTKGLSDFCH
jgi:hypothetical protein